MISDNRDNKPKKVVIMGGGPAGLTAAYDLCKANIKSIVLEKDNIVGGISRTGSYKGYKFDIGGHRFFTKVQSVEDMWHEVLGDDFIRRNRVSRIFYNNKFFDYPLRPAKALFGLGIWNSFLIFLSYLNSQLFPEKPEESFQQWVSNRFGKRLFNIFFKTYTEKVWGMPCTEISADWAAQRIKGLSLVSAVKNALIKPTSKNKNEVIKTLIDAFDYPKYGPGMMWEKVSQIVQGNGHELHLNTEVNGITWKNSRIETVEVGSGNNKKVIEGTDFISTIPIRELIQKLKPNPPERIKEAAEKLKYRDFLTVVLIINTKDLFHDNWIYIHEPNVQVGRIQNFKNWSPYMVPDPNKTSLGLEYFAFEGDGLWTMSDADLIELGKKEIDKLGLALARDVEDGVVVRMPKAYPIYDAEYQDAVNQIRSFLDPIENLYLVGRNGMHKYNNQDHSMLTAMLSVKNILGGNYNLWQVNADQEYHEKEVVKTSEAKNEEFARLAAAQPLVPQKIMKETAAEISSSSQEVAVLKAFSRIDKFGFATAMGMVCGILIFAATIWLSILGDQLIQADALLLKEYFWGYEINLRGAFIGMAHGILWGMIWGWTFAYLRNFFVGAYVYYLKKKRDLLTFSDFLDYY